MGAEPFEFSAEDGTLLRGTLEMPSAPTGVPGALLLSGSGPLDRDSNMPGQDLNIGNALASALLAHGVGSLRFDKRGVGHSDGDYLTTGFDRETRDAASALDALRLADGIDRDQVVVVGHSVGATIAIRLASETQWIAGAVLLAGSVRSGEEVMRWQTDRIAGSLGWPSRLFGGRFKRRQADTRQLLLESSEDIVRADGTDLPARWFREYMAYDPTEDLRTIRCPVLAITGQNDVQVDPNDVARIGQLVASPFTGATPDALTHILRRHTGPPGLATYPAQLKHHADPELLEQVAAWIAGR